MQLEQLADGAATVLITNDLMDRMGITKEQLHTDAMANSPIIRPATMRSMAEVMAGNDGYAAEMLPMDPSAPQMYVVSNTETLNGASAVFYPEFMDQAAKELGGNYFILPSSVHEMLFLPDDGNMKSAELKEMVTSINADVVSPADRLTDSVYHYDALKRSSSLVKTGRPDRLNAKPVVDPFFQTCRIRSRQSGIARKRTITRQRISLSFKEGGH